MSIRPGARIASCKSTMRQFAGISLFARVPSLRITPSSISSRGWSIRSIGVSNVAAVSAIMKNLGVQRTERSFYRKSSISLLKHRGRNQSAEPERRTSTSHVGLSNANVIITTECVVTARFSTVCRGCSFLSSDVGEWLSLVEHLVRDQGVGGSNPLSPTNPFNNLQFWFPAGAPKGAPNRRCWKIEADPFLRFLPSERQRIPLQLLGSPRP